MPSISGFGVPPSPTTVAVRPFTPRALPRRIENKNGFLLLDDLSSTPTQRAGLGGSGAQNQVTTIAAGDTVTIIGSPPDASAADSRLSDAIIENNRSSGVTTDDDSSANLSGLLAARQGVLGCAGSSSSSSGGCSPCDSITCLEDLLTGNLLDADAKSLLCGMIQSAESAAKAQVDATGNALLKAAQDVASAQVLQAPLNTLAGFMNKLDPGVIAKCLGAQQIKDMANAKLKGVQQKIADAQAGVHDKLAAGFNKATEAAQQFSITPDLCAKNTGPASIRSLL